MRQYGGACSKSHRGGGGCNLQKGSAYHKRH